MPGQIELNATRTEFGDVAGLASITDPGLAFQRVIRVLKERRWVIINTIILISTVIVLGVLQLTPIYTATTSILLEPRPRSREEVAVVLSGEAVNVALIESQARLITSRSLAERVIDDLNLANDPAFNASLLPNSRSSISISGIRDLLTEWLPADWLPSLGIRPSEPLSEEVQAERIRDQVVSVYLSNLSVSRDGLAQVIEISFASHSPERAAAIANRIAELYIVDQYESRYEIIRRSTEWLTARLSRLAQQVRQAEEAVEAFRRDNSLALEQAGMEVTSRQIAELNGHLVQAASSRNELAARVQRIREMASSGRAVESVAEVMASPVIVNLRQQQSDMIREEAELVARYGPRHPRIVQIQAQRRDLLANIQSEISRIVANLENELAVASARVASIQGSIDTLSQRAERINQAGIRLRELERVVENNRELYQSFRDRFNITDQQENQPPEARIISRADIPSSPTFPRPRTTIVLGILVSIVIALAVAALLEILQSGFLTAQQVELHLGVPSLGMCGRISKPFLRSRGAHDFIIDKPLSPFSEALRNFRTSLYLLDVDRPAKVVMITSAVSGEGKSVLAASLGRLAAQCGQTVVLVDGDVRRPNVHRLLGNEKVAVGLPDLLAGNVALDEVIKTDLKSSLQYIPARTGVPSPMDLFASTQMRQLIQNLRETFDLVIIDSAPILPVADSRVLATVVDSVVFAVRWEKTPRKAAESALRALRDGGARVVGAVLTMVNIRRHSMYRYEDSGYFAAGHYKYRTR